MIIKTQRNIFDIMVSINTNQFIYYFKRIPLIGKALPESIYGNISLKKKVAVIAAILKTLSKLLGKAIYIGLMIVLPIVLLGKGISASSRYDSYMYLFFIMSMICGSFLTSGAFETNRIKFICIRFLRMNAGSYNISTILFRDLMDSFYFLPSMIISSILMGGSALQGIFLVVLFCAFRFIGEVFHLFIYSKTNLILYGKTSIIIVFCLICLAAAYIPLILHKSLSLISVIMNPAFIVICVVLGVASVLYLIRYNLYHEIAAIILKSDNFTKDTSQIISQARFSDVAVQEKEFTDSDLKSKKFENKEGFAYLNAIFFERHKRLLVKPILIWLVIIVVLFLAAIVASFSVPNFIKPLSNPSTILPAFVIIMYFVSIGERVCKAMFYNCDISLLKYSFYRNKNAILSNFKVRLLRIAGLNLIVAFAISAAVVGLSLIFKLNWPILDVLSFALSIMFLSLFFSVHHLFLYYVFQPYTTELGMKNPFYNIINYGVYFLCFFCMRIKSPPSYFTLIVLGSTLIYIVVALILVYKCAPKTFRVK